MEQIHTRIELLSKDTLALTFPYDAGVVAAIKQLQTRRWNARRRSWEVHLSHLADVMKILGLNPRDVSEDILDLYRQGGWARHRLKVELDPIEGRLAGSGAPFGPIDEATSFFVPGYKFSPKFLAKKWDGKRHLLDRRRLSFPAGLWPRVREVLDNHGVDYVLEEEKPRAARKGAISAGPEVTPLRPYQAAAFKAALKARRGIIQIATGGGKTLLAAHLIRKIDQPTWFFVHTLDLLYQTAEVFRRELGIEVGLVGDGHADPRPVTVATVQTVIRCYETPEPREAVAERDPPRAEEGDESDAAAPRERETVMDETTRERTRVSLESARLVIFDECHHVPADTFFKVAMRTRSASWRFGLSATPWRDDHHDLLLEAALGCKIHETLGSDLIDAGFLVAPRIIVRAAPAPPKLARGIRYQDCYQMAIVENQERNRVIAAQAREWAGEGISVLVLVTQIAHGRALQKLMPEAQFAYGALDSATRQQYLRELEQKLHPILIATTLADEGLDLPSLGAVILGGGGKSPTRAFQRIGRALRPAPGKHEALVLDFLDNVPYLREHSEARLELYRQEPRFQLEVDSPRSCRTAP